MLRLRLAAQHGLEAFEALLESPPTSGDDPALMVGQLLAGLRAHCLQLSGSEALWTEASTISGEIFRGYIFIETGPGPGRDG
jgi:hypothetical protein